MKVLTILGTRPEIIRLSRLIPRLDGACEHVLVHTGQNFEPALSEIFFKQLGVRAPDRFLGVRGESFAQQVAAILREMEPLLRETKPDRLLVLGDTNSGLAAFVAKRMSIPVYHLEAGNRCYDDRVPEEVNRRVIDHCSDVLMPYTERSRANLLREGVEGRRIYVTGNPIREVLLHHEAQINASGVHVKLGLEARRYFLATLHRAENVDDPGLLKTLLVALAAVAEEHGMPVVLSTHPRTRDRIERAGLAPQSSRVQLHEPFGFFDFVALEKEAACVLTDSGTVQEECCILGVPAVTLRHTTERPETVECGSNVLAGLDVEGVLRCARGALRSARAWTAPPEYMACHVSETMAQIVLGHSG